MPAAARPCTRSRCSSTSRWTRSSPSLAARELVAPNGCCIHAVDHVVRGWGAAEHRERLARIASASEIGPELLERTLVAMEEDPDTYFVSAEAHDRWRGALAYDEYPMRRIASVNVFTRG